MRGQGCWLESGFQEVAAGSAGNNPQGFVIPAQQGAKTFRASVSWDWKGAAASLPPGEEVGAVLGCWAEGWGWAVHAFIPSFIHSLLSSFIQVAFTLWGSSRCGLLAGSCWLEWLIAGGCFGWGKGASSCVPHSLEPCFQGWPRTSWSSGAASTGASEGQCVEGRQLATETRLLQREGIAEECDRNVGSAHPRCLEPGLIV